MPPKIQFTRDDVLAALQKAAQQVAGAVQAVA